MAILPTEVPCDMPVLREGHPSKGIGQGQICHRGVLRADCHHFACGGPNECYECGYRDGLDVAHELAAASIEDFYEGMD